MAFLRRLLFKWLQPELDAYLRASVRVGGGAKSIKIAKPLEESPDMLLPLDVFIKERRPRS